VQLRALRRGWRLNQYGLFIAGTDRHVPGSRKIRTEKELANFIGVTYRPPSRRY
jgi:DNA polymerase/3'-5' exonuclease PolX